MGPTAAGKTEIAIQLTKQLPCDIISVDSAMVYRGMNIGTAKPDEATLQAAPHRLVNVRDPWESYSAGDFCLDVVREAVEILSRGRIPLLAGGTMMYFHALQVGLAKLPKANPEFRAEIDARASDIGWPLLHAELMQLDPVAAEKIRPNDTQRIQRALEVIHLSGEKISDLQQATKPAFDARFLNIGLMPPDRAKLHQRIEQRFSMMLDAGFEDEVRQLLARPQMSVAAPAMRAVGYRQFAEFLQGDTDLTEAARRAIVATRRLAKRQITWMRSTADLHLVDSDAANKHEQVLRLIHDQIP